MKILVVDNNATNLKILSMILSKDGYETKTADSLESAIDKMSTLIDLVVIDTTDESGYETCKAIKDIDDYKNIPIILISRDSKTDDIVKAFAAGASDYISAPFKPADVVNHVKAQLQLKNIEDDSEVHKITDSQIEHIFSLAKSAQSKDDDSGKHLERIKRYCVTLAKELTKPVYKQNITKDFIKNIELASPLHDIGKVGISDEIVLKPDKLTDEEFEQMKQHTIIGYQMLKDVYEQFNGNEFIKMAMNIAKFHHERYDGLGYPEGLKKSEIPLEARIMAVADVYDALRCQKPYHDSLSHEKSFEVIKGGRELQFDYLIVKALKKVHHEFEKIWDELPD
ncbi:HD domain-containing protein [bacterium]|nr:HD domain-containing protein [bacterium]